MVTLQVKWGKQTLDLEYDPQTGYKGLVSELSEKTSVPIERMKVMAKTKGLWKGVSLWDLLETAGIQEAVTHVTLRGAGSYNEKVDQFELEYVRSNKVFLAYQVNGKVLPQKHGFPLRVVAEDKYGYDWTKYVHTVEADIVK